MAESSYKSVQKLYVIITVLSDFQESLATITDSQSAKQVVFHIKTAELMQDDSKLTTLFIQLQK